MNRIKYSCKNCGWNTSINIQWRDLKPKRCMNHKCNTSFRKTPEALLVDDPTLKKPIQAPKIEKKVEQSAKTSSKPKTSGKVKQQQAKEKSSS